MLHVLARNWWALLIRGIVAILFGILALFLPVAAAVLIIAFFGAYAFVDGIFAIVAAVRAAQSHERWWFFVIEGLVGIAIGAIAFFEPRVIGVVLYFTIAAWALITGVFEIVAGVQLRKQIANEIWLILGGICSILFSALMLWHPIIGALTIVWLIGIYAIVFGVLMIALSFRLRAHAGG